MTYIGRHRARRPPERSDVMSQLVTSVVAAALLGLTLLSAPPATAVAPVPYQSPKVVKPKPKPCPPQWFCVSPIERGAPRPYGP